MPKPKNIRNFWVETKIDGQKTMLRGGSKLEDGGFVMTVSQRIENDIEIPITVRGIVNDDGELELRVTDKNGNVVYQYITRR